MATFRVYGVIGASVDLGTYEAETEDDAIEMAENNPNAVWSPTLCHHCSNEVDIGEVYEVKAEKE